MPAAANKFYTLTLSHTPHDGQNGYRGQKTWLRACQLFDTVVIATGRQIGKSVFCRFLMLAEAAMHKGFYTGAYMAQGHPQAETVWEQSLSDFSSGKMVKKYKNKGQDRYIELKPFNENKGAMLYFVSGDPEAHIGFQGKTLNRGIADEAGHLPEDAYSGTMRPMFNATKGKGLIIGSPYPDGIGFSWFEKAWLSGSPHSPEMPSDPALIDPMVTYRDPDTLSFVAPSECNPYSDPKTVFKGRRSCTSREQELCLYDGRFARDMGAVFPNLASIFTLSPTYTDNMTTWILEPYKPGTKYVAGLDFGSKRDYSVLSIFTDEPHPKQVLLFKIQGDYQAQLAPITRHLDAYKSPVLYVEGREGGVVLAEMLRQKYGEGCRPVTWARGGKWDKESCIIRTVDYFQQGAWSMLNVPWQREEFRLFSKTPRSKKNPTSSGYDYCAPSNAHDDAVAASAYATYGLPFIPKSELVLEPETPKVFSTEWWDLCRATQKRTVFTMGPATLPYP